MDISTTNPYVWVCVFSLLYFLKPKLAETILLPFLSFQTAVSACSSLRVSANGSAAFDNCVRSLVYVK
jgi:hypothetical protein